MDLLHRASRLRTLRAGRNVRRSPCAGQASVELALVLIVLVPLTLGLVTVEEIAWTYHALATLTRQGARYAATHCWEDDAGSNVVSWMETNAPPFLDRPQLLTGEVQIQVSYWTHSLETHTSEPFTCAASCTRECVPDSVTVSISGYQFRHLLPVLGLQPLQIPAFSTTLEMESAGGDPETGISAP
jgi:hypothetical protein